ncbi:AMP-binding protein [candidate division KSB1 bacterium]|nr:AMP-binding protein [candidate division KSB1 bacterium]
MNILSQNINTPCIYFENQIFSKQEFQNEIKRLAGYFLNHIVSPSPFIVLFAHNHIKTAIAYYAILEAGKIAVIVDPKIKRLQLNEIIGDVDPAVLVEINPFKIAFDFGKEIRFRKPTFGFTIKSNIDEVCTIAYTNAEDGHFKGAMITETNILAIIESYLVLDNISEKDIFCSLLPFYHLFGLVFGLLIPVYGGIPFLISDLNLLNTPGIIQELNAAQVSILYSIPSLYYIFSKTPNLKNLLPSVNAYITGGVKLPLHIYERFYNVTGKKIREGYGLTEASPGCTMHPIDIEVNPESIGIPLTCCDVKIMSENDVELETGEVGEICIEGDNVFKGYLNYEEESNRVLKNGKLHTGDYGKKDSKGYIYFSGLKKNMINVAGINVYPKALVRYMKLHENVVDVEIFSEKSILHGHTVSSKIKLKDSSIIAQKEFRSWCLENISQNMLPKIWNFDC